MVGAAGVARACTTPINPGPCPGVSGVSIRQERAGSLPADTRYECSRCRRVMTAEAFYPSKRTWYRRRSQCIECELAVKRRPPLPRRTCEVCGDEYQPIRVDQRWCSTRCRNRRERAPRVKGMRNCEQCGAEFAWHPKQAMRFCSRRCWARWRVAHGTKPPGRRADA
jgi:predicted nucleic acid-binding Zn ribbon protein